MLISVDIDSENSFTVPIIGASPRESILFRKIDGLEAPDLDLFTGQYARDGGKYQGRRAIKRNVVITADLNPDYGKGESVSSLRSTLYKAFFDPKVDGDFVKMRLNMSDGAKLFVVGYAEKMETSLFSNETACQISMLCPDPYIRDEFQTVLTNPSGWLQVPFTYPGNAKTGFELIVEITSDTPSVTVSNNSKILTLTYPFVQGQFIRINTSRGSRSINVVAPVAGYDFSKSVEWNPQTVYSLKDVVYIRTKVYAALKTTSGGNPEKDTDAWELLTTATSLLSKMSFESDWLQIHGQDNQLKVYGATPSDYPASIRMLLYRSAYWGI